MKFLSPSSSPLQSFFPGPLVFLVVISYLSSYACAFALIQSSEESPQKTLQLRELRFFYRVTGSGHMQVDINMTVEEDETWYIGTFFPGRLENMRKDPNTIVSDFIYGFDSISRRLRSPQQVNPPYRFSFYLPDPLPNYITDEPRPGRPFLEDHMWLLDEDLSEGNISQRINELHWRPWYETFYMDGPFRMQVFYISTDYKLYSGLIEVSPEDIRPYPGGMKQGEINVRNQPMEFQLDFVRDLDDELEIIE